MDTKPVKARVFAPIPPELERVGKLVLDAAYVFIPRLVRGCWNRFMRPVMTMKYGKVACL